jgi:hypothetical protein
MDQPNAIFKFVQDHSSALQIFIAVGATLSSSAATVAVKALNASVQRRRAQQFETAKLEVTTSEYTDRRTEGVVDLAASGSFSKGETPSRNRTRDSAYIVAAQTPSQVARKRVHLRIWEAKILHTEQLDSAKRSKIVANGLTWTNFILGGVLASSFIQETVSPKWTGVLGVLVLVASLIKQHYHPEIDAEVAQKKALRLSALIRSSEDHLAVLDAKLSIGEDHSDELFTLMRHVTSKLSEIEGSDEADLIS